MLKVAIFDDMVAMRGETFHIPGLEVDVYAHADDAVSLCRERAYDVVFMDFAMGAEHRRGDQAIADLRAAGFGGRVLGISSDPAANFEMRRAGADDCLAKKAHLRSFLVRMTSDPTVTGDGSCAPAAPGDEGSMAPGDEGAS